MKTKVTRKITEEIDISTVEINVPRNEIEDTGNGIPKDLQAQFMVGEYWRILVGIDTGKIVDWPQGQKLDLYAMPRDAGIYRLLAADGKELAKLDQQYVPNGVIPGSYGDYIQMQIDETGTITNWPPAFRMDFIAFFGETED